MYYTNDFIDKLTQQLKTSGGESYTKQSALCFATLLDKNKLYYKMFGVYWWAVKEALRKYVNNGEWYCGKADDPLMKERAWHGDLFRTILAAAYYQGEQLEQQSGHIWHDSKGNGHDYTLFDVDAGC